MNKFYIDKIIEPDNPFDRQERISWWKQEKICQAKIMVIGAGAVGNETLKNLALLGFKNIFIVDFDTISISNLSRAILFRSLDIGSLKAEVAAKRTKELCLTKKVNINWFSGDIVWELGTGIYRQMDVVLACLDNIETRLAVNKQCWLAKTPWIDTGIFELGVRVNVFIPPTPPCYQCDISSEKIASARQRYSCDDLKKTMHKEGRIATTQIASSIASAIQVQEAVKLLCGEKPTVGKKIYFQGKTNDYDMIDIQVNNNCITHTLSYPEIIPLPLSNKETVRSFLEFVSKSEYSGKGAILNSDRTFIKYVSCYSCGKFIDFYRPSFRIYNTEAICRNCQKKINNIESINNGIKVDKIRENEFDLYKTEERILNMSLYDIGIPYSHVLAVMDVNGKYKYYELCRDGLYSFFNGI